MHILPITDSTYNISARGTLSIKTAELTKQMSEGWFNAANSGKYKTSPIINTCYYAAEKVNNIFLNLSTIMERFGHACELSFAKSEKTGVHRFFIENKYSNYKLMCGDIEFSPKKNKLEDIDKLEDLEKKMEKINPFSENSNFIIQRKADAKSILHDKDFEPDKDYVFLKDRLVGKEPLPQATTKDIEEYINAAKEEGIIDG